MPDNFESRMNFIIEQQAQFTADIQLLKERQAETREMIRQLADVTMVLARHGKEADRRLGELAEAGVHTERRLGALSDTVDKFVRGIGS
jgi:ABC-type transporter Mla subunit MlaD